VGFIAGAKYGKGVIACRLNDNLGWSAPSTIRVERGNIGWQIGAGETDVIFIVMNRRGEEDLLKDQFTIGADASAMAGPVDRSTPEGGHRRGNGRNVGAEILAYSRCRGIFTGVSLEGPTLRPGNHDNRKIYGIAVTQGAILHGKVAPPASTTDLYVKLDRHAAAK
jgi:SH3 domain-containing YSC84-like protein 1